MKKLLLILLPILFLSCSKDDKPVIPPYPKPEKGDLSIDTFTQSNPEYRKEGNYLYFDFVKFNGDIKGFTKIEHNVFKADETREYRLDMKLRGEVKYARGNAAIPFPYRLAIKTSKSTEYIQSARSDVGDPNKELKLRLNQGDTISFHFTVYHETAFVPPVSLQNDYLEINFNELSSGEAGALE